MQKFLLSFTRMPYRQFFTASAKQFGKARGHKHKQNTWSVAALSWPLPSPVIGPDTVSAAYCRHFDRYILKEFFRFDGSICRHFSGVSLRRPPKRKRNGLDGDTEQKWRPNPVSLGFDNFHNEFHVDDDGFSDDSVTAKTMKRVNPVRTTTLSTWDVEESELAAQMLEIQRKDDDRRSQWLKNTKPPVRNSIVDERGRAYGRGGRKMASARVWIQPGFGNVLINRKEFVDYFGRNSDRELILQPLAATKTLGCFDITAIVEGGGLRGQAGAIRHGLARALNHYNPSVYRPPLKRLGYLTRDPRKVERKKIGHLKARKKPQWVKR